MREIYGIASYQSWLLQQVLIVFVSNQPIDHFFLHLTELLILHDMINDEL